MDGAERISRSKTKPVVALLCAIALVQRSKPPTSKNICRLISANICQISFLYLPCVEPPRYEEPPPLGEYEGVVERYVEVPLDPLLRYVEPPSLRDDEELPLERYDEPLLPLERYEEPLEGV
jgi:hypothetical protein